MAAGGFQEQGASYQSKTDPPREASSSLGRATPLPRPRKLKFYKKGKDSSLAKVKNNFE